MANLWALASGIALVSMFVRLVHVPLAIMTRFTLILNGVPTSGGWVSRSSVPLLVSIGVCWSGPCSTLKWSWLDLHSPMWISCLRDEITQLLLSLMPVIYCLCGAEKVCQEEAGGMSLTGVPWWPAWVCVQSMFSFQSWLDTHSSRFLAKALLNCKTLNMLWCSSDKICHWRKRVCIWSMLM